MHSNIEALVASAIHAERVRDLERRAAIARQLPSPPPRRIRQSVGRSIVRLGVRIAADASLEPGRP
jgi:hypothetical protein